MALNCSRACSLLCGHEVVLHGQRWASRFGNTNPSRLDSSRHKGLLGSQESHGQRAGGREQAKARVAIHVGDLFRPYIPTTGDCLGDRPCDIRHMINRLEQRNTVVSGKLQWRETGVQTRNGLIFFAWEEAPLESGDCFIENFRCTVADRLGGMHDHAPGTCKPNPPDFE